jgi:predicted dehydrogenase
VTDTITWGILSTAKIGVEKVIPAMQAGEHCLVSAIASRSRTKAEAAADKLGIATAYGSYEALLADPKVDAIYNPLPNHLHVPWSIKALEAGKHVLCEKPVGLDAAQAEKLLAASREHPKLKVMEAFMYRFHPQWQTARELVGSGEIGTLRTIETFFSYSNMNPDDIRNQPGIGGGGLMDIGCYAISLSRFIFNAEPTRVSGMMEIDPVFKVDRLTSALLDFGTGSATLTCATQLVPRQRVNIFGTEGRIEIEIPFNAPPDRACRIWHQHGETTREIVFERCNQFTLQAERFAQAVLDETPVPTPLADAVANMNVIDAVVRSASQGSWIRMNRSEPHPNIAID